MSDLKEVKAYYRILGLQEGATFEETLQRVSPRSVSPTKNSPTATTLPHRKRMTVQNRKIPVSKALSRAPRRGCRLRKNCTMRSRRVTGMKCSTFS